MPRVKSFGKRNKRKVGKGSKKTVDNFKCCDIPATNKLNMNSSEKKISLDNFENNTEDTDNVNIIVNISLLNNLLKEVVMCKNCNSTGTVNFFEEISSRRGLSSQINLMCSACSFNHSSMTSPLTHYGYDINLRLVYALRCIGRGQAAAITVCSILNLPPPPSKFARYSDALETALFSVSEASMKSAVSDAVCEIQTDSSSNENNSDIAVVLDGSWQKRGHTSLNGVVCATALDNGKVIDFECMSKYCFTCKNKGSCTTCKDKFEGPSGGMESRGALEIFRRSESTRHARYTKYLGDGDSKAFVKVVENNVYGNDVTIEKLECIGHVQKRMGARLKAKINSMKGKKLADGKLLSGRGRLTNSEILLLQKYYGLAIRRNVTSSVEEMSKAVWACYFHKLSTDKNPQHGLCPMGAESWCGYNKALITNDKYVHKNSLPECVMQAIKPIFRDLSNKTLLSKCLHGQTQNPNESFNNCIWERVPKTTFVGLSTLKIGTMDAIICFNDGASSRIKVLEKLGIHSGINTTRGLRNIDRTRLYHAEMIQQKVSNKARNKKRSLKRKLEAEERQEETNYASGMF